MLAPGIARIMYLFVRGFSRVMYLNQGQSEFDLGEKWRDKLILRDSNRGGGGCLQARRRERILPFDFTFVGRQT